MRGVSGRCRDVNEFHCLGGVRCDSGLLTQCPELKLTIGSLMCERAVRARLREDKGRKKHAAFDGGSSDAGVGYLVAGILGRGPRRTPSSRCRAAGWRA